MLAPPKGKQEGDAILLGGAIQFCVNNVCLFKVCWLAANIIHKIIVVMMMSHNCFRCQCLLSTAFYWHVLLWIISFPHHLLYKIPMGLSHSPLSNIISTSLFSLTLKNQIFIFKLILTQCPLYYWDIYGTVKVRILEFWILNYKCIGNIFYGWLLIQRSKAF